MQTLNELKKESIKQSTMLQTKINENINIVDDIKTRCFLKDIDLMAGFDNAIVDHHFFRIDNQVKISLIFKVENKLLVTYKYYINKKNKLVLTYNCNFKNMTFTDHNKIKNIQEQLEKISTVVSSISDDVFQSAIVNLEKNSSLISDLNTSFNKLHVLINEYEAINIINKVIKPIDDFSFMTYLYEKYNIDYKNNTNDYCENALIKIIGEKNESIPFIRQLFTQNEFRCYPLYIHISVKNNSLVYLEGSDSSFQPIAPYFKIITLNEINLKLKQQFTFEGEFINNINQINFLSSYIKENELKIKYSEIMRVLQPYVTANKLKDFK
jgi:hypothetical protein